MPDRDRTTERRPLDRRSVVAVMALLLSSLAMFVAPFYVAPRIGFGLVVLVAGALGTAVCYLVLWNDLVIRLVWRLRRGSRSKQEQANVAVLAHLAIAAVTVAALLGVTALNQS